MATVDFTLEDVRKIVREEATDVVRGIVREEIVAERVHTKQMIDEASGGVMAEVVRVRKMLEEDIRAESKRLDRVDRRSGRTARLLAAHIADTTIHVSA